MNISLKADIKAATAELNRIQRQAVPRATRNALSDVAKDAAFHTRTEMPKYINAPVAYTRRGVLYEKATYQNLRSRVYLSEGEIGDTGQKTYLSNIIKGGTRGDKRSEKLLRSAGILPPGKQTAIMPAFRNAAGNLQAGVIQQILSGLQAYRVEGAKEQNTPAKKKKGAKWVHRSKFFVIPGVGIAVRRGKGPELVLAFTDPMVYPRKFPFGKIVNARVRERFSYYFKKEVAYQIKKGGWGYDEEAPWSN